MYPSPGHSFLIILQPGHAGFGIDFRKRRLCDFSIAIVSMEFIWWAPFKERIGSAGTFALAMRVRNRGGKCLPCLPHRSLRRTPGAQSNGSRLRLVTVDRPRGAALRGHRLRAFRIVSISDEHRSAAVSPAFLNRLT